MNTLVVFFAALLLGYYLSLTFSHPKKKKHLLPRIKYKNIELMPNVRIHFRNKTYWFHHWTYYLLAVAMMFAVYDSFMQLYFLKGVVLGGVFQGLRYPDRFKFRHPRNN